METQIAQPETLATKVVAAKTYVYNQGITTLGRIMEYADPAVYALMQEVESRGLETSGPLEFIYLGATADPELEFTLQIAQPVKAEKEVGEGFFFKKAAPFKCLSYDYKGDVSQMFPTYAWMHEQLFAQGQQPAGEVREVYKHWEHPSSPNNITEIQIGLK